MAKDAKAASPLKIKQNDDSPVPTEVLAEAIVAISAGIKELRKTRLNDKALFLLIQNAAPSIGGKYRYAPLSIKTIKAVFDGIENLEREFLKAQK